MGCFEFWVYSRNFLLVNRHDSYSSKYVVAHLENQQYTRHGNYCTHSYNSDIHFKSNLANTNAKDHLHLANYNLPYQLKPVQW
jgi:hypothetical protein